MAAPRRGRPAKVNTQAEQLSKALNFVSAATMDDETAIEKAHVRLAGNMAIASTGQISAGHPIAEDLNLCPHLELFKTALLKCGKSLVVAETPGGQLSIKGEKIKVVVPCVSASEMLLLPPDPLIAVVNDKIKEAFNACNVLASEAADTVMKASLLLEANTCTSTNGYAMLQFWHGIDLPPHMVLPKLFTQAVAKTEAPLTGFGFTWDNDLSKPGSITFWFEGGAWLRVQCYSDRWQDVNVLLDVKSFPVPVPEGLFEAIEACEAFVDDKSQGVYFGDGCIQSHLVSDKGAQYEVPGLMPGKRFNGKMFRQTAKYAESIDLTTYPDRALFFGAEQPVRGIIMGMVGGIEAKPQSQPEQGAWGAPQPHQGEETGSHLTGDPSDDHQGQGAAPVEICGECNGPVVNDSCLCDGDEEALPNVGWG